MNVGNFNVGEVSVGELKWVVSEKKCIRIYSESMSNIALYIKCF